MGIEVLITILAGIISLVAGAFLPLMAKILKPVLQKEKKINPNSKLVERIAQIFSIKLGEPISYLERTTKTLDSLKKASEEMEIATFEFNSIMKEKQATVDFLEGKLSVLSLKETELRDKINTLQNVPIEAMKHFEEMLNKGNKRSAYRDYLLFGAGVVVSVIVGIILNL